MAAGIFHTVILKEDGTLWACGSNGYGQLGDGTTLSRKTPIRIGNETDWISVTAGSYNTFAARTDGSLRAWGYNYYGQLGDRTTVNKYAPTRAGE